MPTLACPWFSVFVLLVLVVASLTGAPSGPILPDTTAEALQRTIHIYSQGSYADMFHERFREWMLFNSSAPFYLSRILSLFLLGFYVWRMGLFQDLPSHLPAIRKVAKWGLWIGVSGNACFVLVEQFVQPNLTEPSPLALGLWTVSSISTPALSLFYAGGVILLFQREAWRRRLVPFAAVGRMALTNYLLQSIVCTTLYNSYGLGLFGKVGPLLGLAPTVAIYAAQVVFSEYWLRRFRYGPAEWLWRSMTYGRV